nr:prolipoprotein diacylglyceryl transferase [Desulfobacterales bacterium]
MYPILFQIGPFVIHTYGVFVAAGFLLGIDLAIRRARPAGMDTNRILDLSFYLLISTIAGARLLYILINPEIFRKDPMEMFRIWHGGLVFYGGFILTFFTFFFYVRKHRLDLWKTADVFAPSIAIGQAVGRIGCFFAGCCYGKECSLPWAVTFTRFESLAPKGIPLHPTQLYSSLNAFGIFLILVGLHRIQRFPGQIFWTYVLLYTITRFGIEFFRGDFRGIFVFGIFSISQVISILGFVLSIVMLMILRNADTR